MTGNWPCYRFLQIEAWNACRIFYSLELARPLQVSKTSFWDIFFKIRFHSFVGLDLEHRLSTHNIVISLELKAKKNIWWKNQKTFFECPFEIIGFICWPLLTIWNPNSVKSWFFAKFKHLQSQFHDIRSQELLAKIILMKSMKSFGFLNLCRSSS